jgi:hypothetical protein
LASEERVYFLGEGREEMIKEGKRMLRWGRYG